VGIFVYSYKNTSIYGLLVGRVDDWEYGGLWHFKIGNRDILGELPGFAAFLCHCVIVSSWAPAAQRIVGRQILN
jgi:hypothetical protein